MFPKRLSELCAPALFYFAFSIAALFLLIIQNMGNRSSLQMAGFSCRVPSTMLVFIVKLIYILFWTWILNLICKDGYKTISWLLVLLPWTLMIIMVGLISMNR